MLVLQSHRSENLPEWIQRCMESVREWAELVGAEYYCAGDREVLSLLPVEFVRKLERRWPMLVDLGRLLLVKRALEAGEKRVVWLDADVLVFDPKAMRLPVGIKNGYAFGREDWIEKSCKVRRGVHNALCVFEQGNPFLDYYIHACERIVEQHEGQHLAPQLLGPKFLKMQYNLLHFELCESVAMLSPVVVQDMLEGEGRLWEKQKVQAEFGAVNLCGSLVDDASGLAAVRCLLGQ
ncbi:hypothetical protein ACFPK9_10205 [Rubritalea spongiae]|uniref:Nucleotide-diphospho-sugar transferase domain-containing protein n=1 Tax=Rubritalea spongiae TaxID=430797 RepID=A0ABW5DZ86_9BACT